jgi:hypothetical protein
MQSAQPELDTIADKTRMAKVFGGADWFLCSAAMGWYVPMLWWLR